MQTKSKEAPAPLIHMKSQNKKGYIPLPPVDDEIRRIITSNGYGENSCCSARTNCFLEKLSLSEAVMLVKRYVRSVVVVTWLSKYK